MKNVKAQYRRYTRSSWGNFFYFFFLILFGLFSVLPMIYTVCTSLKPLEEILIFPPRFFVTRPVIDNYTALPKLLSNLSVPLSRYIFNSLFVSVSTTVLHIFIASMAAFVIAKVKFKGSQTLFMLIQFALLYNAYTLAIPQYVIFSKLNIIDTYWVYILPYLPSTLGVFLVKQFIDSSIPDALLEAGRIDGAGIFRIYYQIALPIMKPAWLTLALFAFRDIWSMQPAGTIFSEELKMLPNIMSTISAGGIARSGSAMAATVILLIPPIIVYMVSQGSVMETMGSAGIKG
ncbi:MAG: carbohydrate ABC transporter permease [Clostridia bacterium]|nr:carbohydrate ABC transporter permease [Clostridia bacterium]